MPPNDNDTDYINAGYIDSPFEGSNSDRKFIACQGPLPHTIKHLWRMVLQENVTLIISTCNLVENGIQKCEKFWPDEEITAANLSFENTEVN